MLIFSHSHIFSIIMNLNGEQQQPTAKPNTTPTGSRYFKLPDFWTASPAAWFGMAEAQFLLQNITSQQERLALVAAILPEASARHVAHLLVNPGDTSYTDLKAALLSAHQLTSFQQAECLFSSKPLGDRCPKDFLSELLEWVHPSEERSRLLATSYGATASSSTWPPLSCSAMTAGSSQVASHSHSAAQSSQPSPVTSSPSSPHSPTSVLLAQLCRRWW